MAFMVTPTVWLVIDIMGWIHGRAFRHRPCRFFLASTSGCPPWVACPFDFKRHCHHGELRALPQVMGDFRYRDETGILAIRPLKKPVFFRTMPKTYEGVYVSCFRSLAPRWSDGSSSVGLKLWCPTQGLYGVRRCLVQQVVGPSRPSGLRRSSNQTAVVRVEWV